jgi:RHH-type transcriptional regulator, rel operon repressor / antitoxin RelB
MPVMGPMNKPTPVWLPDETHGRLLALARRTGRTVESHIREAVEAHLDDIEDAVRAEEVLGRIARGEEGVSPLEDVERRLGLAD